MNCSPFKSTEEKIREAAKQVFLEKGFDGATSRDIADKAGINIALTNYYFRSKEKLFVSIFEEMFQLFFNGTVEIMNKQISLREKISELIEHDFQLLKKNPSLSIFIMNEVHRNPERMATSIGLMKQIQHSLFEEQLKQEIARGNARPISSMHLMPLIFCNIQFIFIGKAMQMKMWQMSEADFDEFTNTHKQLVIDMITTYLFEFEKV
ncbi:MULTISPECIES: TetR/AcrR family transcriptional regulator [Spirosoma]|uniref:TetR/AcrR family transcriptional regulator n=1 Tax=Spirosoma liriopis TaxID=2937440 RepID=A0ABT0HR47_9BACT|nr:MULTISPECIES: TetR/AcrR family transcriptional regulator [Spirosoma]MCK8494455.1 TetR/AcrR family transcriptional regulator [Spirosoma liriopis]UHG89466.1 TetR/AcrR family transcriptional regulator [Spirosoma oryzicola]